MFSAHVGGSGFDSQYHINVGSCGDCLGSSQELPAKDQDFEVVLYGTASSRPAWAI